MKKLLFGIAALAVVCRGQNSPLTFNGGQPLILSYGVSPTPGVQDVGPISVTTTSRNNSSISLIYAPIDKMWLQMAEAASPNTSCSDLQSRAFGNSLSIKPGSGLCLRITPRAPNSRDPRYVAQGWYLVYLKATTSGLNQVFPIQVQVTPGGYLKLYDSKGAIPTDPANGPKLDALSNVVLKAAIDPNARPDDDNFTNTKSVPSSVSFQFSAIDPNTQLPAYWLNMLNDQTGQAAASPATTALNAPYYFRLTVDPSQVPAGSTALDADFSVSVSGSFQDTYTVRIHAVNLTSLPQTQFTLPSSLSFGPNPGSQTIQVASTRAPIAFQASFDKPWLTVTPWLGGTPTQVTLDFDPTLMSQSSETGTLTFSDQLGQVPAARISVTATRSVVPACTYQFSAGPPGSLGAARGSASVDLNTQQGCPWSAAAQESWLRITRGAQGNGPGTIFYDYDANTGAARQGHITAQGQTFTITQSAAAPVPTVTSFTANPQAIQYGDSSTLTWVVNGASSVTITPGIGSTTTSGSVKVRPGRTTAYSLLAINDAGRTTNQATVSVTGQPPSALGILSATVNPILLSGDATTGNTTLTWAAPGSVKSVEIHSGAPGGPIVASGGGSGSTDVAAVADGTVYYLQDVTANQPLTTASTLDSITIRAVPAGSTIFSASPLYIGADGQTGNVMFTWNAPAASAVALYVASSSGPPVTGSLSPSGSQIISASWLSEGQKFFLQTASGDANTVAQVQLSFDPPAPAGQPPAVTFYADPNPILVSAGQSTGSTTLYWNAPGYSQVLIYAGSQQMTGGEPNQGSLPTPAWVQDGLIFTLRNAGGQGETLGTITMHVQQKQ